MRSISPVKVHAAPVAKDKSSKVDHSSIVEKEADNQCNSLSSFFESKTSSSNGDDSDKSNFGLVNFNAISILPPTNARIQPKLKINKPGDKYEIEADRVAEEVTRIPDSGLSTISTNGQGIQRKCSKCEKNGATCPKCAEEESIQLKPLANQISPIIQCQKNQGFEDEEDAEDDVDLIQAKESVGNTHELNPSTSAAIRSIRSGGRPMSASVRKYFEPRFGFDFSNVKIHNDHMSHRSAQSINARAYTIGQDIVFGSGQYAPEKQEGKRLLAHELTHVIQQSRSKHLSTNSRVIQRQGDSLIKEWNRTLKNKNYEGAVNALAKMSSSSQKFLLKERYVKVTNTVLVALFTAANRMDSNSGVNKVLQNIKAEINKRVKTSRVINPASKAGGRKRSKKRQGGILNFYHGTRWSIATKIPNNVKAIGGGDFASGFYTHQDADDSKALNRAKTWALRVANQKPKERYAGVVVFKVPKANYQNLLRSNSKVFNLTDRRQTDYKQRQKEWIDFVRSHGREKNPVFRPKRQEWAHEPRDPQPKLGFDIVKGPFYRPIKGKASRTPRPSEFDPFAEGTQLPHQVTWANKGVDLLNSSKVKTELKKYDATNGSPAPVPHIAKRPPVRQYPTIGPARGPAKKSTFCMGGSIGCSTLRYLRRQFMPSEKDIRKAINIEYKLLSSTRPAAGPRTSYHGETPIMKRTRLLRAEARKRVLTIAGLKGLINTKYAQ